MQQTAVLDEMETERETDSVVNTERDSRGVLKQNREFLDYFWNIIKPDRETRLRAVHTLIQHLQDNRQQTDELKYTLKRLVDGLCHTREEARSGYSLALAQVLSVFEEITLRSMLDQIREKHNLQTASKKQIKPAVFGNFFGVLALSQSTRLNKEADVLLECVKLLQSLSQYKECLRDLPRKTIADILNEVSEQTFEEVLFSALQEDLRSALRSPEQLELLLLVMRRFSSTLNSAHLDKLLGTTSIINTHTLPRLVEVMKTAARSVKKERVLPAVASDLLHVSLREDTFTFFWDKVVIDGLLSDPPGPSHYLAFRLMGVSLPLLSVSQLQYVLSGEVMRRYGEHVMTAQLPERFKFSPEMDECVCVFLRGSGGGDDDVERQVLVLQAFSRLTLRGSPVIPSFWKVLEHVDLSALRTYTHWLTQSFCKPNITELLEFSTRKQRRTKDSAQDSTPQTEECVLRLRKWIIPRLACIVENNQIKKDEELVMEITRFIFFHAFFDTLKSTTEIPETQRKLSPPLDQNTRNMTASTFFSVLHSLSVLPVLSEDVPTDPVSRRSVLGVMANGCMWVYVLVQYANTLLKHTKHVRSAQTLSAGHTLAWDSMLQSVESLSKKMKKSSAPEHSAFQHLFLIIGIQMFKAPDESVELLNDLRRCMEQAQTKKSKKKKQKSDTDSEQVEGAEPHWVEVVVDILLSLLAQPSRLIRSVCKTTFSRVCPYITQTALSAILNVLDPSKDEEESGVLVTDDSEKEKKEEEEDEEQEAEEEEECDSSHDEEMEDEDDDEDEEDEEEEEVDQNFRLELMKVLQGQNALAADEDGSEEDELDDEAMMKLDKNLATLFGEQKKKVQAKKDEKERQRKEKTLVRDFKIKVLDLLDVFLCKQGSSVLVLGLVEPLLNVIETCMSTESGQHEQDFLRRAAHIFRNQLCRGKHYCREVEGQEAELHDMLERLIGRAQKLSDSSVALYYFSAALYLVKVLRGAMKDTDSKHTAEKRLMGKVDVERVTSCFRAALTSFMTRRKSPLRGDMFTELFNRFPVLCVNLLDTVVENIKDGVKEHQQGQACVMVLRALQCKEVKQLMSDTQLTEFYQKTTEQLTQTLQSVECVNKVVHEKTVKALELAHFLIKTVHHQKLEVKLDELRNVLRSMNAGESLEKSGKLEDTYWSVMKLFGIQKMKVEKVKKVKEDEQTEKEEKKKKGFLPESKKRKNRKRPVILEGKETIDTPTPGGGGGEGGKRKKKNNKKKRSESESHSQPPAKKPKAQQPQRNQEDQEKKKKKQKKKRRNGGQISTE